MVGYYVEYSDSGLRMGCEGWDGDATILDDLVDRLHGIVEKGRGFLPGYSGGSRGSCGKGFGYRRFVSGTGVQAGVLQSSDEEFDGLRQGSDHFEAKASVASDLPGMGMGSVNGGVSACKSDESGRDCCGATEGNSSRVAGDHGLATGSAATSSADKVLSDEKKVPEESSKGKWYASNKRKRAARAAKARHSEPHGVVIPPSEAELAQVRAKETLAKKWAVENELAAERARRSLEIIRASDLQDDIRRHTTRVKRHTEANMVAIEKTHKYLSKTGNVAGEPAGGQGFAETIIGESISPDSSASMQEFRAAQKQVLDLQLRCEKLEKAYRKAGGNPDAIDLYDKSLFTMEDGTIAQHYVDQFADLKLTWGFPEDAVEYRNGKKKTRVDFYGVRDEDGDDFGNIYGDC